MHLHSCHNWSCTPDKPPLQSHHEEEYHKNDDYLLQGRKYFGKSYRSTYVEILGLGEIRRHSQQYLSLLIIATVGQFDVS